MAKLVHNKSFGKLCKEQNLTLKLLSADITFSQAECQNRWEFQAALSTICDPI